MEYSDKSLTCVDCGQSFVFSIGEQMFFSENQFQHAPKRCKKCKAKGAKTRPRVETSVTCAACGASTIVPFVPRQERPVLCRMCFYKQRVFSARLRSRRGGLILGRGGATASRCELPINFLNREGLGIVLAADPIAHFLMLFMVGIGEGGEEFIKTRDASAVVRRTRETSIDTDWAVHIREERQQLLEDDCVLPVITEVIGVDELGAGPSEDTAEPNIAFVLYLRSHADVFRVRSPEVALPGSEFVHVAVVPTHCCLQNIVQFGQGHRRRNKQPPPDRRLCAE